MKRWKWFGIYMIGFLGVLLLFQYLLFGHIEPVQVLASAAGVIAGWIIVSVFWGKLIT